MARQLDSTLFPSDHPQWSRVEYDTNGGCWLWSGPFSPDGYGQFAVGDGKTIRAHRAFWSKENGDIPDGMVICHKCDTPRCVNPQHLRIGTQADNIRECVTKGRKQTPRGKHNRLSKVNVKMVLAIRDDPRPQTVIAKEYGLCQATVSEIKRRLIWKWLADGDEDGNGETQPRLTPLNHRQRMRLAELGSE